MSHAWRRSDGKKKNCKGTDHDCVAVVAGLQQAPGYSASSADLGDVATCK